MNVEKAEPLRVLAADDSAVMRSVMRTIFQLHSNDSESKLPKMELCGVVKDGMEAMEAVLTLRPDVLVLDLEMPRLSGLGVLERLRKEAPGLPVIMCSAYTDRGARSTLDALSSGAKDYVMKPHQQIDFASALDWLTQQLLPKIAALAGPVRERSFHVERRASPRLPSCAKSVVGPRVEVVVIGVSTGGPSALEELLPAFPQDLPVPILIVQHMPKLFTGALAERLNRLCRMQVSEAKDGALALPGTILLAPGDAHLEIARGSSGVVNSPRVKLHQGPILNGCKPSVDYLFSSAAQFGKGTLALMMTGMGCDGMDGTRLIRDAGGTVLAQDEATSAVWGMPGRIVQAGLANATLPLHALAGAIMQRVYSGRMMDRKSPSGMNHREAHDGLL